MFSTASSSRVLSINDSEVTRPIRQNSRATSTSYRIYVENESPYPSNFFIFQEPAVYEDRPKVCSNSLGVGFLPAYHDKVDEQLSFFVDVHYLAGAWKQVGTAEVGQMQVGNVFMAKVNLRTDTYDTRM